VINREKLAELNERELATFAQRNPKSKAAYDRAEHLFGRVPMTWMNKKAGGFPVYLDRALRAIASGTSTETNTSTLLSATPAQWLVTRTRPWSSKQLRNANRHQGGLTTMLPTEDAEWVAANLSERFGMAKWSFALTATDANRWAIRLVRAITGKPKILFNSYCYHGSVDEALIVVGPDGEGMSRPGNVGSPVDVTETSRVAEFNDLEGLERQLKRGDVAAVLMEPALTNIGIVLPEPGYLDGVRELTRKYDTLLIIDETHTFSAGYGGMTMRDGLEPDVFVIGKAIAGGIPTGTYGLSAEFAEKVLARTDLDLVDMGGVGGTLAGNPLSVAAMRATLEHVLTKDAFGKMIDLATYFTDGVNDLF
jgi:glutamate-1-semialdehyde 2,1-aminomutase